MENLYKGPKRFDELSNNLVVFRFSFFTLTIQLSLSHREEERNYIISLSYRG